MPFNHVGGRTSASSRDSLQPKIRRKVLPRIALASRPPTLQTPNVQGATQTAKLDQ